MDPKKEKILNAVFVALLSASLVVFAGIPALSMVQGISNLVEQESVRPLK